MVWPGSQFAFFSRGGWKLEAGGWGQRGGVMAVVGSGTGQQGPSGCQMFTTGVALVTLATGRKNNNNIVNRAIETVNVGIIQL